MVLLPVSVLLLFTTTITSEQVISMVGSNRIQRAFLLSFSLAFFASLINAILGTIVAWTLARYRFPCHRICDALVDLPFALPTAVAGIALTAIYAPSGFFGRFLEPLGIHVAFTPLGILIALIFVGFPFVVRTVQPILEQLNPEIEEAAATLGATQVQSFVSVLFPILRPGILTGFSLAFARALGEYGSVVFISGNLPLKTEIVPLLIMSRLEEFDHVGAAFIASAMLVCSLVILMVINYFVRTPNHSRLE